MPADDPPSASPGRPSQDDDALYRLGLAYARGGRWPRAAAVFRRLARRRPDLAAPLLRCAEALLRLAKPAAAGEAAAAALRLEPHSPEARRLYGVTLACRRRFADAAAAFRAWAAVAPNEAAAEFSLARALLLAGEEAGAEAACRRAAARDRSRFRPHLLLARLALAQGRLAQAQAHLKDAVEARPQAASLRAMLARVLLRRSRLKGAAKMAQMALAADPGCDSAALVLAELRIADGDTAAALPMLRRLAERRPDWPELRSLEEQLAARGSLSRQPRRLEATPAAEPARPPPAEADGEAEADRPGWEPGPGMLPAASPLGVAALAAPPIYAATDIFDQIFLLRALILRQLRLHYRETRFGFLLEYVRPTVVMGLHYLLFTALKKPMPGKIPVELFIIGSFTTWFAAIHVMRSTSHAARDSVGIPGVSELHIAISRMAWEFMSMLAFSVFCVFVLKLCGLREPLPNIPKMVVYYGLATLLGLGLGLVLQSLRRVFASMETVTKNLFWILYVTSGHYFSVSSGRHGLADLVLWNPLLHISELTRQALYPGYPTALVSVWYPVAIAAGLILTGLVLERCTRNPLRD